MSVLKEPMAVLRTVPTIMDHTSAVVILATVSALMVTPASVHPKYSCNHMLHIGINFTRYRY